MLRVGVTPPCFMIQARTLRTRSSGEKQTTNVNANIVYETHLIIFLKRLPALLHKYRMKTVTVCREFV